MDEARPEIVEYQQPGTAAAPTGGEVLCGTLVFAFAVFFALSAVLPIVAFFVSPAYRSDVGLTITCAAGIVFGLMAAFCGRFSYELFQGRKVN